MTKNEENVLRANLLGGMDTYVRESGDEDKIDYWLREGVPDDSTEEDLMEIAEDENIFAYICEVFSHIVNWIEIKEEN